MSLKSLSGIKIGQYTLPTSDGTNGQVLQTDGTGNVTFQSTATEKFINGLSFDTTTGVLTAEVSGGSDVSQDLDGRYALSSGNITGGGTTQKVVKFTNTSSTAASISDGPITFSASNDNSTFAGDVTSQGYAIDGAGLQTFQDFQSKPIDTNSGLFTVGGNGMQSGYSRAVSMWSSTDGVWNSWVGTNLRWDGTNFKRASDNGGQNWGNIAGIRFLGNSGTSGAAMQFIIDPPIQSSAPSGEQTIGTTLPASMTALSLNNDLSATFAGLIKGPDGSGSAPTYSFSDRTDTGMWAQAHSSNDRIMFNVDGSNRAYIDSNGITSTANVYATGQFRNYSNVWAGTTGVANNGFYFLNTAGGNTDKAMELTHDGNATFAGNVILNSRLTFDYGGDHYLEAGTNTWNFKNSSGTVLLQLDHSDTSAIFSKDVTLTDGILTVNDGNNYVKISEGSNSIGQIELKDGSPVFVQGWGTDFRVGIGTYDNHALIINSVKQTKVLGDFLMVGDGNEFWLKSDNYNLARIIPRGGSGTNLDKGLLSLFTSDGTTNNIEKVRIDSAGGSWFNGGNVSFGYDVIIPQGAFIASQTSLTNPVARFTNTGVNNYDFTFPDNSTLQLGSSVGTDLIFKLLNAGAGDFNLDVGGDANFAGKITLPSNKAVEWPGGSIRAEGNTLKLVATTLIDLQDNTQVQGNLSVLGDLNITGDINSTSVTNLDVTDKTITIAKGAADSAAADGGGIVVDGASASLLYDHTGTQWEFNKPVEANSFIKSGGTSSQFLMADGSVSVGGSGGITQSDADTRYVNVTGDTMTGTLTIDGQGSNSDKLLVKGSARIALENANATDSFYLSNTGGNNASVLDLGGSLSLVESGNATFAGAVTIANTGVSQTSPTTQLLIDNNNIDDGGGYNIDFKSSSNDTANRFMSRIQALRTTSAKSSLGFFTESGSALTRALLLDENQNATFGGHIIPAADATYDLGTTNSLDFRTLYIREIDVYNQRFRLDSTGTIARFQDHSSVGDGFQFLHLGTEILRLGNGSSTTATFAGNVAIPSRLGVGANSEDVEAALTVKGDPGNTNQPVRITNSVTDTHTGLFLNSTGNAVNEKYGMQFGGYNEYSIGGIFGVMDNLSGSTSGDITIDFANGTSSGALVEKVRFTHEGNANFAGKINAKGGANITGFTAATINAYTATVSSNLFSALRIIENTGASSYWDIGATGGASTLLNFYHNGTTTPKISFTHAGGATFAGDITLKQYGYINFGSSTSNQLQFYNSLSGATLKQYGSGDLHLHSVSNSITFQAGVSGLNTNYGLKVVGESIHTPVLYDLSNTSYYLDPANSNISLSIAGDAQIGGGVRLGGSSGQRMYTQNFSSLTTTGVAVAGLTSGSNGASANFVFETAGGGSGGYQRVVFNCINVSGTWSVSEEINEGGDRFNVTSSGNGSTVTFTFKARSSSQSYSPKVSIKAFGQSINETYF